MRDRNRETLAIPTSKFEVSYKPKDGTTPAEYHVTKLGLRIKRIGHHETLPAGLVEEALFNFYSVAKVAGNTL